jgi:hypothetical protein
MLVFRFTEVKAAALLVQVKVNVPNSERQGLPGTIRPEACQTLYYVETQEVKAPLKTNGGQQP